MQKSDAARPVLMDVAVAMVLLTRVPLPKLPNDAFARQAYATWAFPLIGALIGGAAALVGGLALDAGLAAPITAGLVLGIQIMLTGALHEDGLADTADGFWGGHDRVRRLEIMKDSAIGSYGVLALILSIGLRWTALTQILPVGAGALIAAAMLSRAALPILMTGLPPARTTGLSHHVGAPPIWAVIAAAGLGTAGAWAILGSVALPVILVSLLALGVMAAICRAKIGGQTGDTLGAAQQVTEIVVLLGLAGLLAS